jgi:hypothetical protein
VTLRRQVLSLVLVIVSACTSVTRATVTPSQLETLAGLKPNEERSFLAGGNGERLYARGDDEVRLLLTADAPARKYQLPWVRLSELQWNPPTGTALPVGEAGTPEARLLRVPVTDVTGADLRIDRYDPGLTVALVLGIVLGLAGVVVGSAFLASLTVHPVPATASFR